MKTKNLIKYFMVAALVSVIFAACKKRETTPDPVDNDTSGAVDNSLSEGTFNDVSNIADQGAAGSLSSYLSTNNGSLERGVLSCATVVPDTANHKFTITFQGGSCGDGKIRNGSIIVTYSGSHYYDIPSTVTITFNNYSVNGNVVNNSGVQKIFHKAPNGVNPLDSIYVNVSIAKYNSGGTITWVSHRTREWTEGFNTPTSISDDVYKVTGGADWSHSNGSSFHETCNNLKIHMGCNKCKIESGQVNITPAGKPTRYVDFGHDGDCDYTATVMINNISYTFSTQ